jgi:hypothetical protein
VRDVLHRPRSRHRRHLTSRTLHLPLAAVSGILRVIMHAIHHTCGKPPTESTIFEKYARVAAVIDEVVNEVRARARMGRLCMAGPPRACRDTPAVTAAATAAAALAAVSVCERRRAGCQRTGSARTAVPLCMRRAYWRP